MSAALLVVQAVLFPYWLGVSYVSSALFVAGMPVLAALLAAWPLRLGARVLALAVFFVAAFLGLQLGWLAFQVLSLSGFGAPTSFWIIAGGWVLFAGLVIWNKNSEATTRKQRVAAIALVVMVSAVTVAFARGDEFFWRLSERVQPWLYTEEQAVDEPEDYQPLEIEADRLWEAQPRLVSKALKDLRAPIVGARNVYGIAVAAQGTQRLFSREAQFALTTLSARFPRSYRGGVLLSNGRDDLMRDPLATHGNLASVAKDIARRMDPARDVLVVYLTSHGGSDAALSTELPDYQPITPISASAVAAALDGAGIRRRIVIVSACYSGTWIPLLANENTIVISAAAKDRTSFGCSEERRLTFFGEAFLEKRLPESASLQQAFESARRTIAGWEARDDLTESNPQAFVGRNMRSLWSEAWQ